MNMDFQIIFNAVLGVAIAMGGWIMGRITRSLDQLDSDVRSLPDKYVSKSDYHNDLQDIKSLLNRIFDKLDGKEDKHTG